MDEDSTEDLDAFELERARTDRMDDVQRKEEIRRATHVTRLPFLNVDSDSVFSRPE